MNTQHKFSSSFKHNLLNSFNNFVTDADTGDAEEIRDQGMRDRGQPCQCQDGKEVRVLQELPVRLLCLQRLQ